MSTGNTQAQTVWRIEGSIFPLIEALQQGACYARFAPATL